uniref:Cyclin-like domain-containing protein n=1 Tax=Grammatophora oceanica TaxID=210454 RepID=A0A7S1UQF9_9STRA|mmetsp:Transcript_17533/g.25980  ORF Transcript_17533/g.25980 Transcript_17533/m.25980 type:complete len:272 (+) Transcript_17533:63-878(+)
MKTQQPQHNMLDDETDNAQYVCMCKQEQQYMADDYLASCPLIDEECRRKMVAWYYQVVDFCHFDRETVEICVNFLERFLSSDAVSDDITRNDFQLIAMTSLYVAIKIHEPIAVDPKTIAGLSGGQFTVEDIEACERRLLPGLSWRMNPPTTMSFVRMHVRDLSLSHYTEQQVLQLTKTQLETAIKDYSLMTTVLPSTLAKAAISNSMSSIGHYRSKLTATVDAEVADVLAYSLPSPLCSSPTTSSMGPKRTTLVRYESNGELSPKCVSAHP